MTVNKRKKFSRYRGSMTHGCGSKKKRRGSGNRGGKGMAGTGKRSDRKKPSIWNDTKYFGKFGFKIKNTQVIKSINIDYIEEKISSDIVKEENGFFSVDLGNLGFNKLLSGGKVTNKYKIKVHYASKKAVGKVKGSGGKVILG